MTSKHTPKRNELQRNLDRTAMAEMLRENPRLTDEEIAKKLAEKTGIELSRQMVQKDRARLLSDHAERQGEATEIYLQTALADLEKIEAKAEEGWARSLKGNQQERERQLAAKGGGMYIAELETLTTEGVGDPRFLSVMLDVAKERSKLLGLYAPKPTDQTNNYIFIKGFAELDQAEWKRPYDPERVIDG